MKTLILLISLCSIIYGQSLAPAQSIFMQGNNINAVFRTDGYFNYDKVTFSSGSSRVYLAGKLHRKD
jgi:hypothetical protein